MSEDRCNPVESIRLMFMELRQLYAEGYQHQIEGEIAYMTGQYLHDDSGEQCAAVCRLGDYIIFDPNADVISEHLTIHGGCITDLAAEAIVRQLANGYSITERANFNGWLDILGFEELKRKET